MPLVASDWIIAGISVVIPAHSLVRLVMGCRSVHAALPEAESAVG